MATSESKNASKPLLEDEPKNVDEIRSALERIKENTDSLVLEVLFVNYLLHKKFKSIKTLLAELKKPNSPLRALDSIDPAIMKDLLSVLEKGSSGDVKTLVNILEKKITLAKFRSDEQLYFSENPTSEMIIMATELVKSHNYDIG